MALSGKADLPQSVCREAVAGVVLARPGRGGERDQVGYIRYYEDYRWYFNPYRRVFETHLDVNMDALVSYLWTSVNEK